MNKNALQFYKQRKWDSFLTCLSYIEYKLIRSIAAESLTPVEISDKTGVSSNIIWTCAKRLAEAEVIELCGLNYKIANSELIEHLSGLPSYNESFEVVRGRARNIAYKAYSRFLLALSEQGRITGNAADHCKLIDETVEKIIKENWIDDKIPNLSPNQPPDALRDNPNQASEG